MNPVAPEVFKEALHLLERCRDHLEYCGKTQQVQKLLHDIEEFDLNLIKRFAGTIILKS